MPTILEKSLEELEALADKVLQKSVEGAEDLQKSEEEKEDIKPEDIVDEEETDSNESEDKDEPKSEEKENEDEEDELEKSINTGFEREDIQGSIEVSEFLAAIAEVTSESLLEIGSSMRKSVKEIKELVLQNESLSKSESSFDLTKSFSILAKSQKALIESQVETNNLIKSIDRQLQDLSGRLEEIEGQPNMRKSISDIRVHERNFRKSIGGQGEQLTKSQKVQALTALLQRGDSDVTTQDVISVESGAPMRTVLEEKVTAFYRQ